jgi:hypothetical protein
MVIIISSTRLFICCLALAAPYVFLGLRVVLRRRPPIPTDPGLRRIK